MRQQCPAGRFITFEGIDGSGKTTQIRLLKKYLLHKGQRVFVSREPGGTGLAMAEAIRKLILNPRYTVHPRSELLLYEASRAQHVEKSIVPMLKKGYWVLCDRFTDATLAYQGGGRGIPTRKLLWLNRFATHDLNPDITILLDLPVRVGLTKARLITRQLQRKKRNFAGDRIEQEKIDFHRRVQGRYRALAKTHKRIHRIPVEKMVGSTHRKIIETIESCWPFLKNI